MKGAATRRSPASFVRRSGELGPAADSARQVLRRLAQRSVRPAQRSVRPAKRSVRLAKEAGRLPARAFGGLRARWRRSLQVRVVGATLVISAVVVTVLGFLLMQQISSGILQAKVTQAGGLVADGQVTAEQEAATGAAGGGGATQVMQTIMSRLAPKSPSTGSETDYGVAVVPAPGHGGGLPNAGVSTNIPSNPRTAQLDVPVPLTQAVTELQQLGKNQLSYTPAKLDYAGEGEVPGLAFGAPVTSYYQLYYFFPLTQEQQSLALVQRTLLAVGAALVFLLVGIAALVTRWVVTPVRGAARAAQRLATGNFTERVPTRGSDEVAVLATSFNEMAASLQDKMAKLEDLSQVQRQFVSDVSHELRTPLTTIRIAADVLYAARSSLADSTARSAELLQSQLGRFESLLTDLLEISRYDANVAVLDAEPVDICDLVRHSADVAQQLAERRGAKIEFRLPAEPCVTDADRRRVERVLRNLLINAVEHGEGRDAVVTVAADSAAVAVAVRDYGVGLAPGEEHQVFERFWRADPSRARKIGGTGLGLAIALEDARLHGGWLEAWGRPGRGSVFRLTLPRVVGAELAGSPLPLVPEDLPGDGGLMADLPGISGLPAVPTVPDGSDLRVVPDGSDLRVVPDESDLRVVPDESDLRVVPDESDLPVVPGTPGSVGLTGSPANGDRAAGSAVGRVPGDSESVPHG